tara:strand:- start:9231 stop:11072 length:1842 start_codon:yes stop_codon:yes gene_type:complete
MVKMTRPSDTEQFTFARIQAGLISCSEMVGEEFFPKMVEALAKVLSVRWVLLSKLHPSDCDKSRTLAFWDNGWAENFEYRLDNSPCGNVVSHGACSYSANLGSLFPDNAMLQEMAAESYVGTPLRSSSGEVLGILAALDDKPLRSARRATEIVELFSGRTAAELERLATASLNERLGRIVEDSVSEAYIFRADNYHFELVNRGARENLGYSMEELRSLTPWALKPKFTKNEFLQSIAPLRSGEIPNLLFETLHERKDGSRYDVSVQLQFFPGAESLFYAAISDITERKRAEQAQAHLAAIVESSREAIISKALDGTIQSWNQGAERIFGYSANEIIGKSIRLLIPPERQDEEDAILEKISRAEPIRNYETVRISREGSRVDVSVTVSPIFNSAGRIIGASKIAHDIRERKQAEERERLLVGEVNHRAKNILALVQAIARQTAAKDTDTFVKNFEARILALSASHDLLVHNNWHEIELEQLVRSQLGHFKDTFDTRIKLSGPLLKITASAAQAIGMAVYELATNAAKYGALSEEDGTIAIRWELSDSKLPEGKFTLQWTEQGGRPVEAPTQSGFGSMVIDQLLAASLQGQVEMDWRPTGLVCTVTCPATNLLSR